MGQNDFHLEKEINRYERSPVLKECYAMSALYAETDESRKTLQSKEEKIQISSYSDEIDLVSSGTKTIQHKVSKIFAALIKVGNMENVQNRTFIQNEIYSMPNCADKDFIMAIQALNNGRNESQRIAALRHISLALAKEPNDPRYLALAEILQEVDR